MSCSNSSKKVAAKISLAVSTQALSSMTGGLVVFGKNTTTNDTFVRVLTGAQSSIEEELTVGTWDLGAMGWDGAEPMTGTVYCAQQLATSVTTGPVVFNLSLSNAACFGSSISPETGTTVSTGIKKFASINNVAFCSDDLASLAAPCTYTFGEPSNTKVPVGSYSIDVTGVKSYKGVQEIIPTEYLRSFCFNAETHEDPAYESVQSLNIPRFNPGSGLSFRVVAHMSDDCSYGSNLGQISIPFRDSANFKALQPMSYSKSLIGKISIDQICSISNQLNITEGLASGTGDPANPYLICNVNQFYSLQRNFTTYYQKSFLLGKDIDLLYGIKAGSVGANPFHVCLDDGDTFIPIGYEAMYIGPGECDFTAATESYSGNFDGNNKTIKNFRFKNQGINRVGLFSKLNGGGITNLILEKIEIEGGTETGSLVGYTGNSGSTYQNIKIKQLDLRGKTQSGGVFGSIDSSIGILENIQVVGANLRAEGSEFGGIVGYLSGADGVKLHFDGVIDTDYSPQAIGGIVGSLYSLVTESASTGMITGTFNKVGGIAGILSGGSISFARSDMLIFDRADESVNQRYYGGIAGFTSTESISRSLFFGDISSPCTLAWCYIGAIAGTTTAAITNSLSTKSFPQDGGDGDSIAPFGNLYTSATKDSLCSGVSPCPWTQITGVSDIPRFADETHICQQSINTSTIATQKVAGRGPATNPFVICHPDQLTGLQEVTASETVILESNLNLMGYNATPGTLNSNNFVGKLDGKNRIIHSLNPTVATNEGGVFGNLASTAVIKNLTLSNITNSNCSTCKLGVLASVNNGEINNVRVFDSVLESSVAPGEIGGIVSENGVTGKILNSKVDIDLIAPGNIGGAVYKNSGLIEHVDSRSYIQLTTGTNANIGGIVGRLENTGKVKKSEFGGEIRIDSGSPTSVGGIVGFAVNGATSSGEISDVIVRGDAYISLPPSAGSMIGGILGETTGSGANIILSRAIFSGNLMIPFLNSITSIGAINPSSVIGINATNTKKLVTPLKELVPILTVSTGSYDPGTELCTFSISTSSTEAYTGEGAIQFQYKGPVRAYITSSGATTFTITSSVESSTECASFSSGYTASSAILYKQTGTPDTLSVSGMKSEGFDIVDMDNDTNDAERMYTNYLAFLQGLTPPTPPVWEMDEGEPRIFVFDK